MEGGRDALIACNLIVILLDGMQVDNGAALELGFAYAKGIPAVGIRTDARCCGEYAGLFVRLAQKEHGTG